MEQHMTELKIPSPGESITQVQLAKWLADNGTFVEKDQEIAEIDSDKATFPLTAPVSGILTILIQEGETVEVGAIIGAIEESDLPGFPKPDPVMNETEIQQPVPIKPSEPLRITPLAKKILEDNHLPAKDISPAVGSRRITRKDVETFARQAKSEPLTPRPLSRTETRKKLSTLRMKLAERLVSVKNETAMLTTFNEVNMRKVLDLKASYTDRFKEKYGIGIGFMSLFSKAVAIALQEFPQVNSMIDGEDLITPHYVDLGIAVSAPKGLVVPVIRNVEQLSIAEIELNIKELATKARENRISIDDMKGGTFTITNGGVFGSLMSTPILNPPQSAILGMHKIMERPVAVNGNVEVHPMMYIALSYDHRVIDGRESVGFLVRIKELVEHPVRMLTLGEDPYQLLLDINQTR